MKKQYIFGILFTYFCLIAIISCKKDSKVPPNPFDDPNLKAPAASTNTYNPAPTSFEYLFENVFSRTCDNSGCHDGSFEPDFRNISSAYNSLVYAPIILTPTTGTYPYRVTPGNSAQSVIAHRLTQYPGKSLPNAPTLGQGRMPWNDTTWRFVPTNKTYIQNIIDWIDAGAKDVFGNAPVLGNKDPNTMGIQICNTGNATAFNRTKYVNISKSNGPVDIWCYVVDDNTAPQNMASAEIKFSLNRYDFSVSTASTLVYTGSGNSYQDITLSGNVQYNYKLTGINLSAILPDTGYIFMRTYIKDTDHTIPSETPNNGSVYYTDDFIIKITP